MTMVEGLIGKKIGITQSFDEQGNVFSVTVILAGPCTVFQKKTEKKDGYSSIQIGFIEEKGRKKPNKPLTGHSEKAGVPPPKILREFRFIEQAEVKVGDQFFVDIFEKGEKVHITGRSKGKGFAGVVKRWGYHGGKASHGSMFHRRPGSIGASAYPSRVVKGKKLPGHLGDDKVTVRNLIVVRADKENNLLVVKGAIPGANGGYLLIKKADFEPTAVPAKPTPSDEKNTEDKKTKIKSKRK
jgi:large subunit ribosomal protein L3